MQTKNAGMPSASFLAKLILVIISGLILLTIISLIFSDDTDIESQIVTCRASNEAREFANKLKKAVPMLCKTIDIEIPEPSYEQLARRNFTKAVKMNIADRVLDCWYMFGEGIMDRNVFGTTAFSLKNRCFACFTFTIRHNRNYADYEPISPTKLEKFFYTEPYKPIPRNVPFCLHDQNPEDHNCLPDDASECERNGGYCFDKDDSILLYDMYEGWSCDSRGKVCYVSPNMVSTYFEHMISEAPGLFAQGPPMFNLVHSDFDVDDDELGVLDPGNEIYGMYNLEHLENQGIATLNFLNLREQGYEKGKMYGISFISDTRDWGVTIVGAVAGAAAVIKSGGLVIVIAAVGGAAAGYGINELFSRDLPTILVSTLEDIEDTCSVRKDFNQ